jgi:hypothetical protein
MITRHLEKKFADCKNVEISSVPQRFSVFQLFPLRSPNVQLTWLKVPQVLCSYTALHADCLNDSRNRYSVDFRTRTYVPCSNETESARSYYKIIKVKDTEARKILMLPVRCLLSLDFMSCSCEEVIRANCLGMEGI